MTLKLALFPAKSRGFHASFSLFAAAALLVACGSDATSPGSGGTGGAGGTPKTSSVASVGSGGSGGATGGAGGGASVGSGGSVPGTGGQGGEGGQPMPTPCPGDMAFVASFCMDLYEAPNQAGAEPLVMQSAVDAEAYCASIGKRLCTEDEWDIACEGPNQSIYPYGDAHIDGECNDYKTWKAPNEGVLNTWPSQAAQDEVDKLYQAEPSGSLPGCVSGYGVFDLTGNVEEWVVRTKPHVNNYPHVMKGCYWSGCYGGSKPKCSSTNPAHADGFKYYETGFRCCADMMP